MILVFPTLACVCTMIQPIQKSMFNNNIIIINLLLLLLLLLLLNTNSPLKANTSSLLNLDVCTMHFVLYYYI